MNVEVLPSRAFGEILAPVSKSFAHRLLICAALSGGTSKIENLKLNDDILATVECLKCLGAEISITDSTAVVKGISVFQEKDELHLHCNESGSTLRFLIPLSMLLSRKVIFTGSGRLMERPQDVYINLFKEKLCSLNFENKTLVAQGNLASGIYEIRGDVSSQFITGLLLALPLLEGDSKLVITTPLQSKPYVDITIETLKLFGVEIFEENASCFYIKGNQRYVPCDVTVEGDWSNAAFLDAFNLISKGVTVTGLNNQSAQGDKAYKKFYELLKEGYSEIDISQCPDLGPVLIIAAVLCNGARFTGTKRLSIKESDRAAVMKDELKKFGVKITVEEDEIIVPGCTFSKPEEIICCHNDHRIAMAFTVLCSVTGGVLSGAQCVNKSYPHFWEDIKSLGVNLIMKGND